MIAIDSLTTQQIRIKNIVNKLELLGNEVLDYNSFGIIYRGKNREKCKIYKLTPGYEDDDHAEGISFLTAQACKHFIVAHLTSFNLYLFVERCPGAVDSKYKFSTATFGIMPRYDEETFDPSGKMILLTSVYNAMLVNYRGDTLDISSYKRDLYLNDETMKLYTITEDLYELRCEKMHDTSHDMILLMRFNTNFSRVEETRIPIFNNLGGK